MLDRAMVQATLSGKQSIYLDRALPLSLVGRQLGQCREVLVQMGELVAVLGAVEELESDHRAGRNGPVDDRFVEVRAQLAADGSGPGPRAGICQLHLRGQADLAQPIQRGRGQVGVVETAAAIP